MRARYIIFMLLFIGIYTIAYLFVDWPERWSLRMMGTFGMAQLLLSIYSSVKTGQRVLSPYVIFLIVLYTFTFGQSLLYVFDIKIKREMIGFLGITLDEAFVAQYITMLFLGAFHIGYLLNNQKVKDKGILPDSEFLYEKKRIRILGWFLSVVTVYPYYKVLITKAVISMTMGYGALFKQETAIGLNNWMDLLGDYFIPGLICLFIGYKDNYRVRMGLILVMLANVGIIFLTGGRTEGVIIITLILILQNYLVKAFTKKDWIWISGVVVVLMVAIAVVGSNRAEGFRTVEGTFTSKSDEDVTSNGVVDAIAEMGNSMFTLVKTKEILDKKGGYRYGSTYLYATTSVIPNLGFWDIHPAVEKANMGNWLTDELRLWYGTGFSMVAEAYVNFGELGAFMMMFLGYVFSKIFGMLGPEIKRRNLAMIALVLVFYWFSLKIPRNSFISVIRAVCYFALPICWIIRGYIFSRRKQYV